MAENSGYIVIEMYNKTYDLTNRSANHTIPNHTISNPEIPNSKISNIKNLTTKNYDLLLFKSYDSTKISKKERRISHSDSRDSEHQIPQRRSSEQVHFSDNRSPDSDRWLIDYKSPISHQKNSRKMSSTNPRFSNHESQKTESKSPNNGKVMLSVSQSLSNTGSDIVKQGYLYVKRPPGNRWNRFKAWHKRYFVLKESGDERGPELVMYSNQNEFKSRIGSQMNGQMNGQTNGQVTSGQSTPSFPSSRKTFSSPSSPASLSLFVHETVHIGITSESHRFQHVLVVVFSGRAPLLLAAEDELTARMWMQALDLTSSRESPTSTNNNGHQCPVAFVQPSSRNGSSIKLQSSPNHFCSTSCSDTKDMNMNGQKMVDQATKESDEDYGYINHPDIVSNNVSNNNNYSAATMCGSLGSEGSGCSCLPAFIRDIPDSSLDSSAGTAETAANGTGNGTMVMNVSMPTPSPLPDFFDEKINVGQVVERFPIYFIPTEDSERIGLRGSLQLVIYLVTIGIARKGDKECFVLWPINVIRQYRLDSYQCGNTCSKAKQSKIKDVSKANVSKSKDGTKTNRRSFYRSKSSSSSNSSKSSQSVNNNNGSKRSAVVTIEVGRRCSTGEGIYKFSTEFGEEIIREIKKTVSNLAAQNSSNVDKVESGHFRRRTNSSGTKPSPPPSSGRNSSAKRCLSSMAEFPDPFRTRTYSGSTLKGSSGVARAAALARLRNNQIKTGTLVCFSDLTKSGQSLNKRSGSMTNGQPMVDSRPRSALESSRQVTTGQPSESAICHDDQLVTKSSNDISTIVYSQPFFPDEKSLKGKSLKEEKSLKENPLNREKSLENSLPRVKESLPKIYVSPKIKTEDGEKDGERIEILRGNEEISDCKKAIVGTITLLKQNEKGKEGEKREESVDCWNKINGGVHGEDEDGDYVIHERLEQRNQSEESINGSIKCTNHSASSEEEGIKRKEGRGSDGQLSNDQYPNSESKCSHVEREDDHPYLEIIADHSQA